MQLRKPVKRMTSPELWEQSRLRYNNMWENEENEEEQENILVAQQEEDINRKKEDDLDIELNEKEAPFLRG